MKTLPRQPARDGAHSRLDSTPANHTRLLEPQHAEWSEPSCLKQAGK